MRFSGKVSTERAVAAIFTTERHEQYNTLLQAKQGLQARSVAWCQKAHFPTLSPCLW